GGSGPVAGAPVWIIRGAGGPQGCRGGGNIARRRGQRRPRRAHLCDPARVGCRRGRVPPGCDTERQMKLTVPTMITLLRILLIPVLVLVFYLPFRWTNETAAAIFAIASLTDWLDGWIARRYNQYSAFGAFLDPVADKLMVATALML